MKKHKRKSLFGEKPVHYSDRCTRCGTWFTESSVGRLKAVTREHMRRHRELDKASKRNEKGGLKDQKCTRCGKGYLGTRKGLCTRCFERSIR